MLGGLLADKKAGPDGGPARRGEQEVSGFVVGEVSDPDVEVA